MGKKIEAAIDIGTNTVLLLVGRVNDDQVAVLCEQEYAPRLGQRVDREKNLQPQAIQRVIEVLKEYKSFLNKHFPDIAQVKVTATSAVREANNRSAFLETVKRQTGFNIQMLSGEEEAIFTFKGAQSVLALPAGPTTVLDIGGGSTEVAVGSGQELIDRFSFDMGSVRFTERYLQDDPPTARQLKACRAEIADLFQQRSLPVKPQTQFIGVAGTVTALAQINAGFKEYDAGSLNGRKLSFETISHWVAVLGKMSSRQLLHEYPNALKGRADLILAGLFILEGFMKRYKLSELIVSTGGIRHGALLM